MSRPPLILPARLEELFPDWSNEVDRRIASAEVRIKFWVVGGAMVNGIIAACAAIPMIFYMGQITASIQQATTQLKAQDIRVSANTEWIRDRMVWEARVEAALASQHIVVSEGNPR